MEALYPKRRSGRAAGDDTGNTTAFKIPFMISVQLVCQARRLPVQLVI